MKHRCTRVSFRGQQIRVSAIPATSDLARSSLIPESGTSRLFSFSIPSREKRFASPFTPLYLPLKYNDGTEIEAEKIKQIREELIAVFGALTVSSQSAPYQGSWKYGGVDFIDDIIKIEIIAGADRKTERSFKEFKERLKRLLKQIDILITAQTIRTI
ncbi:MAG: hypothetical protein ACREQW_23685 [Candidatus Binatia bacterium]